MGTTTACVLGISGSLRSASTNTALLRAAGALVDPAIGFRLWDELATIPPFDEDHEAEPPDPVLRMREAIDGAAALVIATSEYNGSIPGQLKNALDWASRPYGDSALTGKTTAVIGASPSDYGATWAQDALRRSLEAAGAHVLDTGVAVPRSDEAFDADGRLADAALHIELGEAVWTLTTAMTEKEGLCDVR
ncbi:NADPH-dependent FMN reductase [Saccharopolyspora erythraea]|uniref:NADPH-dependent FMN reductase n=1 Tax=Saccharopolyspora erythraea TaxID=1836 RepID=UPI00038D4050|nr:NAD(P)H-dependent oxidoreductase [Saccharopolyspora erythraea]EQD85158.1 NADPH-dependent FMN reductase [Saccharopolyspora erythraea D]QRK90746.1 NAD(P)H-dependent oxidoreductase [Saccharopolyspora erythraea]